jgi:hypothetical protein
MYRENKPRFIYVFTGYFYGNDYFLINQHVTLDQEKP